MDIALLCFFAFCAGIIDAVVGGGGLIQIPALVNVFPEARAATIFGTNKLASVCGTAVAARSYVGKVSVPWQLVLPAALGAFALSFVGASCAAFIPQALLRPVVLVLVVAMAVYTFWKKDFGSMQRPGRPGRREHLLAIALGGVIGFYDGLFGPGTGSFLIFLFIRYFAFDFLQAAASAKFVNIATNLAALVYFVPSGNVLYGIALSMAAFNMLGAFFGARIALKRGAGFVRLLFLCLLAILIFKLASDIALKPGLR